MCDNTRVQKRSKITSTTFEKSTEGMNLTPDQIYEINQQRRALVAESNTYLLRHDLEDRPRLSDAMEYRYRNFERGDENALKGVTSKQLDEMQKLARYDLTYAHYKLSRTTYDASNDGYKYNSSFSDGEKWQDAVEQLARAKSTYEGIKAAREKRALDWVKRHKEKS